VSRDFIRILSERILKAEIGEQRRYRLAEDMIQADRSYDAFDKILEKVEKLAQGFSKCFHGRDEIPNRMLSARAGF
jgi:hypothetical protein